MTGVKLGDRLLQLGCTDASLVAAISSKVGLSGRACALVSKDAEEKFKSPIREQYERQGHPYYASARLWDDGVVDPADTRRLLGLAISALLNAPVDQTKFGVFRM